MTSITARLSIAVLAGFAFGALTSFAQGFLPHELSALANSAAPWALVAFALALLSRSVVASIAMAVLAMLAMLVGYVVASDIRGHGSSSALLLFWGLAAIVVGPALGTAAVWLRTEQGARAAMSGAAVAGLLVGEGVYGLTVVNDSTASAYWIVEAALGVLTVVVVSASRLRGPGPIALCVVLAATVAVMFRVIYAAGDISAFG